MGAPPVLTWEQMAMGGERLSDVATEYACPLLRARFATLSMADTGSWIPMSAGKSGTWRST